jgi:ferredoxin-NADP reductase
MHDTLQVGDTVKLGVPCGRRELFLRIEFLHLFITTIRSSLALGMFTDALCGGGKKSIVLVAAGIGATPMSTLIS